MKTTMKGDRDLVKLREKGVNISGFCSHLLSEFWAKSLCISVLVLRVSLQFHSRLLCEGVHGGGRDWRERLSSTLP